jgi:predicted amidohydrolase YtcJ
MIKKFFIVLTGIIFLGCKHSKKPADLIIHNGTIYTVDSLFTIHEAMAIKDGKILELGKSLEILSDYESGSIVNLHGKTVYPGFIDAHCHFLSYGLGLSKVDLVGTTSFEQVVDRVYQSSQKNHPNIDKSPSQLPIANNNNWIVGRGWDQNDWTDKSMPTNKKLDSLFPDRPVILTRIDGHAALANTKALQMANVSIDTKIDGCEIVNDGKKLTGLLIDNSMDLVKRIIPRAGREDKIAALVNAQNNCLAMGLTTVDDAGLMYDDIELIDSLQKNNLLKMRVYAMLSDSLPNYTYFLDKGPYKTDRLNVRAFKFYADGALGSRGACLFKDYSDKPHWKGFLLSPRKHFEKYAEILDKKGFQMCTHCIGDSALNMVITIYGKYCNTNNNHRWRIEHAQVVTPEDCKNFSADIIPSVQPTHATSDMYWVETRLGKKRVKNAYAFKDLDRGAGLVALGTDFPVEDISPFKTFYAATARKDDKNFPPGGFQMENALTRKETLRGMTIQAAYSNFEEKEKGSLEKNKVADFIILDRDIMKCELKEVLQTKVLETYINGEKVYSLK